MIAAATILLYAVFDFRKLYNIKLFEGTKYTCSKEADVKLRVKFKKNFLDVVFNIVIVKN